MNPFLVWLFPDLTWAGQQTVNVGIRKTAHVLQFLILALLLWRAANLRPALPLARRSVFFGIFGISLVLALASEGVQIFSPHRGASGWDVLINLGGCALAFGLIGLAGRLRRTRPILVTADLHLDETAAGFREEIRRAVRTARPSALVVAGDVATADCADAALALLREAVGPDLPVIICLGNHDYWSASPDPSLVARRERVWRPACKRHRVQCLDFGNVELGEITLCGGYGHYDFGFRATVRDDQGVEPVDANYQAGEFSGIHWNDVRFFPPGTDLLGEANREAAEIRDRLREIPRGRRILWVTHTAPGREFFPPHPEGNLMHFLDAFYGNSRLSSVRRDRQGDIFLAVSGHTHQAGGPELVDAIPCVSVGSEPGHLRWLLVDPRTGGVRRWSVSGSA